MAKTYEEIFGIFEKQPSPRPAVTTEPALSDYDRIFGAYEVPISAFQVQTEPIQQKQVGKLGTIGRTIASSLIQLVNMPITWIRAYTEQLEPQEPFMREWRLEDPEKAKKARDTSLPIEERRQLWEEAYKEYQVPEPILTKWDRQFREKIDDIFGDIFFKPVNKKAVEVINSLTEIQQKIAGPIFDEKPGLSSWNEYIYAITSGMISLGEAVGLTLITKDPKFTAVFLSSMEASDVYNRAREQGVDPQRAFETAVASGYGTYLLEKFGIEYLFGATGANRIMRGLKVAGVETLQEETQTVWQNLVYKYGVDEAQPIFEGWWETAVSMYIPSFLFGLILPGGVDYNQARQNLISDIEKKSGVTREQAERAVTGIEQQVARTKEQFTKEVTSKEPAYQQPVSERAEPVGTMIDATEEIYPERRAVLEEVSTDQKKVLESMIKDQEKINYIVVPTLKDAEGNLVASRFEWNRKTQEATIYASNAATAENIAHELGHYFNRALSRRVDDRLSDMLPDYNSNKSPLRRALTSFVVKEAEGTINKSKMDSAIKQTVTQLSEDVKKLSKAERRASTSEKFASAVREVILRPDASIRQAPVFTRFIQHVMKKKGFLAKRLEQLRAVIEERIPEEVIRERIEEVETKKLMTAKTGKPITVTAYAGIRDSRDSGFRSTSRDVAQAYAYGKRGKVIQVTETLKNPYVAIDQNQVLKELKAEDLLRELREQKGKLPPDNPIVIKSDRFIKSELSKQRYDSVIYTHEGRREPEYQIFKVEGIKVPTPPVTPVREVVTPVKRVIRPAVPEKPLVAVTGLRTRRFVERPAFRLDKINAPEDVTKLIGAIAIQEKQFRKQRISKTNEDIRKLAQMVDISVDDLLKVQPGSIANSETVFKARTLVTDLGLDLRDTNRALNRDTATPAQILELRTKLFRLTGTMKTVTGFKTEGSHLFRQNQIETTPGEFDIFRELIDEIKDIDKEAAGDIEKFIKGVKQTMEATLQDKIWHLWYMSILSGISTQLKNIFGDLFNMIGETARVAATNPTELPIAISGLYDGFIKGRADALEILKKGDVAKLEERNKAAKPIVFTAKTPIGKQLARIGNAFDYVGRFMAAVDAFFRGGFRGMESYGNAREVAKKEGLRGKQLDLRIQELIEQPLQEMLDEIDQFAKRGVYMQKPTGVLGWLSNGFSNMIQVKKREKAGTQITKGAGRTIVPFTRIVANVVNNGLDWTPIGFIREGIPARVVQILKREEVSLLRAQKQELGRAILGTIAMAFLASLTEDDKLSGNGPRDKAKRDVLFASGWRPNSIKIGNIWYPYSNWGPFAIPMMLVGNYHDMMEYRNMDQKTALQRISMVVMGSIQSIMDMSFLSGVSDLFDAISDQDPKFIERYIGRQITIPFPNLIKQFQKYFDPTAYEATTVKEQIMLQLGITSGLKPRLNVFGDIIKLDPISGLSPVKVSDEPLYRFLAENELWVSIPSKATLIRDPKTGEKRQMNPDEYYNYIKLSGPEIKTRLSQRLDWLKSIGDNEMRQKKIDEIIRQVREEIKARIQSGSITQRVKNSLEDLIARLVQRELT